MLHCRNLFLVVIFLSSLLQIDFIVLSGQIPNLRFLKGLLLQNFFSLL
jgi:hypothetical protein